MARTHYVWDPFEDNVIEECDENGDTLVEYETEPDRYGNLISQEREGVASYFHFDGQGSTLALTNEVAEVTDKYAYSAFGETTEQSGNSENSRRYIGEEGYQHDTETDGYIVRERGYEPVIARWLSRDPAGFVEALNLYLYVGNEPTLRSDPSGNCTICGPPSVVKGGPLSAWDSYFFDQPFTRLGAIALKQLEIAHAIGKWSRLPDPTAPMTAGPQEFKKLRYVLADGTVIMEDSARAANFLFFVVFPVCNAEECSIQTFEKARQRTTVWRGNPGAEYLDPDIPDWIDTGDARPNTEPMATESSPGSWLRAFGKVAVNECVEYVIYVDMPGSYSMWISFPLEGVPYGQLYSLDDSEIRLINGDGEVESKANVAVKMHIPVQWKQRPKMTFSLLGTMPEGGAVYPGG